MTNWLVCALEKWRNMSSPPCSSLTVGQRRGEGGGAGILVQASLSRGSGEQAGLSTAQALGLNETACSAFCQLCYKFSFLGEKKNVFLFLFVLKIISSLCSSFVKFLVTFCLCRCEICNSVGSSEWLMVHPPVILRQAGEYVHFAWFPSSIFQTSPELGVTQLETGFRRSSNTNGRVGPDDTITLFSMNTSANMLEGGWSRGVGGWGAGGLFCRAGTKASV